MGVTSWIHESWVLRRVSHKVCYSYVSAGALFNMQVFTPSVIAFLGRARVGAAWLAAAWWAPWWVRGLVGALTAANAWTWACALMCVRTRVQKISARGALGALYRERWERWERCIGSARERWGAFSALASAQGSHMRSSSARRRSLHPVTKTCVAMQAE